MSNEGLAEGGLGGSDVSDHLSWSLVVQDGFGWRTLPDPAGPMTMTPNLLISTTVVCGTVKTGFVEAA